MGREIEDDKAESMIGKGDVNLASESEGCGMGFDVIADGERLP